MPLKYLNKIHQKITNSCSSMLSETIIFASLTLAKMPRTNGQSPLGTDGKKKAPRECPPPSPPHSPTYRSHGPQWRAPLPTNLRAYPQESDRSHSRPIAQRTPPHHTTPREGDAREEEGRKEASSPEWVEREEDRLVRMTRSSPSPPPRRKRQTSTAALRGRNSSPPPPAAVVEAPSYGEGGGWYSLRRRTSASMPSTSVVPTMGRMRDRRR